ncbi:unnamed protein product [Timema podura]|uniref:Uncharacterized protein n=1 Tax=Timema podura TaxID=61482 RepID=A0ABN7PNP8_TIMPD|nr:unnamed protein product [Timema podura]
MAALCLRCRNIGPAFVEKLSAAMSSDKVMENEVNQSSSGSDKAIASQARSRPDLAISLAEPFKYDFSTRDNNFLQTRWREIIWGLKYARSKMKVFLIVAVANPPEISLGGLVVINRNMYVSILSMMATYLVVLAQFGFKD